MMRKAKDDRAETWREPESLRAWKNCHWLALGLRQQCRGYNYQRLNQSCKATDGVENFKGRAHLPDKDYEREPIPGQANLKI